MTPTISGSTFKFLKELKANNNRDWFLANKPRFEMVRAEFEGFITDLLKRMSKSEPALASVQPKDCIFRIYRDVRFSKDKSPYKTHIGAYIVAKGRKTEVHAQAGYYIHVEPGSSMLAGGAYGPDPAWLKAIRQEIDYNGPEFLKILKAKNFKEYFGGLAGEQLTRLPKGYTDEHPMAGYLKHKSFLAVHDLKDKTVLSEDFLTHCTSVFKAMQPLNGFLNRARD